MTIEKYTHYNHFAAMRSYYDEKARKVEQSEQDRRIEEIEKDFQLEKGERLLNELRELPSKFVSSLTDEKRNDKLSDGLIRGVLFETFMSALYLDDDAKELHVDALRSEFNDMYDACGAVEIFKNIDVTGPHAKEHYLKNAFHFNLKKVAHAALESYRSRKLEDLQTGKLTPEEIYSRSIDEHLNFDMTEDEKEEFEYDVDNLQLDTISDTIKKKVLDVVMEERERSEQEKEIEEELAQQEENSDDGTVVESAIQEYVLNEYKKEPPTLFRSITESVIKAELSNAVMEGSISGASIRHGKISRKIDSAMNSDAVEVNTLTDPESLLDESDTLSDLVLADSITHYTLLETFFTLGITNYTTEDVQELSRALQ